jgi:hypothetical protein
MWATLALMAATWTPAQAGELELKNVRETYGVLGQERKDNSMLPGDILVVAFDIENLQVKPDGRVQYSMGMQLIDKSGKALFTQDPKDLEAVNVLGGSRLPSFALAVVGTDTAPGEYTLTVTVKDRLAMKQTELKRKFEVLPTRFGIVRQSLTYNPDGSGPAPPLAVPGQMLWLNFTLIGYDVDKTQDPDVDVVMQILDDAGKPTVMQPFTGKAHNINEQYKKLKFVPMQFPLQLNRTGKFKIVLKASDKMSGKTVEQALDLNVVEPK